jgi:hypothetical protein
VEDLVCVYDVLQSIEGVSAKNRSMHRLNSNEKKSTLYDIEFGHLDAVKIWRL